MRTVKDAKDAIWTCPFCGTHYDVISQATINEFMGFKNCMACDYHQLQFYGSSDVIAKICEPL